MVSNSNKMKAEEGNLKKVYYTQDNIQSRSLKEKREITNENKATIRKFIYFKGLP